MSRAVAAVPAGVPAQALFDAGRCCRADDRGGTVIPFAPPRIAGPAEFDLIEQILRGVLTDAWTRPENTIGKGH